jgi:hypothetical protein
VRSRTAHLAISISNELGQKLPFLAADLEPRPAPLLVMASGGEQGKHPWGGSPSRDDRRPTDQGRTPLSVEHHQWSSWVFTLCRCLPGLASCHDISLYLLIRVGLHLLQMRWPSSCRSSFLPGRGSWIAGKAPSSCGRMDWRLLSMPLKRLARNVMPVTSELRLFSMTSVPRCAPLVPGPIS